MLRQKAGTEYHLHLRAAAGTACGPSARSSADGGRGTHGLRQDHRRQLVPRQRGAAGRAAAVLRVSIYSANRAISLAKRCRRPLPTPGCPCLAGLRLPRRMPRARACWRTACCCGLAGEPGRCYLFLDDFHLLRAMRASRIACARLQTACRATPTSWWPAANDFLPAGRDPPPGAAASTGWGPDQLRLNEKESMPPTSAAAAWS